MGVSAEPDPNIPLRGMSPAQASSRLQPQGVPSDTEHIDRSIPQLLVAIAVALLLVLVLLTSRAAAF